LLYESVQAPFVHTSIRTAEMVKYAANAFHALKVCFANEVADVCAALGADGAEVMRVFAMDRKLNVSEAYLRPGFAFGGSCLPKDLRALLYAARAADVSVPLLASVLPSNDGQVRRGVDAVLALRRLRIGVVGLSFQAGVAPPVPTTIQCSYSRPTVHRTRGRCRSAWTRCSRRAGSGSAWSACPSRPEPTISARARWSRSSRRSSARDATSGSSTGTS